MFLERACAFLVLIPITFLLKRGASTVVMGLVSGTASPASSLLVAVIGVVVTGLVVLVGASLSTSVVVPSSVVSPTGPSNVSPSTFLAAPSAVLAPGTPYPSVLIGASPSAMLATNFIVIPPSLVSVLLLKPVSIVAVLILGS